ncbi:MAG: hypothetical protein JSV65_08785 [Armatimonadota bacterium]|nr:MAG: hypothetical protein JSV65_08785 [Armatimonadota bacterium]
MRSISTSLLEKLRTPHKHPSLVFAPSYRDGEFDSHAVDGPFVFAHDGRFYMTYIGWDGIGYRTGLASSHDLINWHREGLLIDRGPTGSATEYNAALTWILRDNDLFGSGGLKKVRGCYLGTYHAYPSAGYEAGPAVIGLCWSDDLHHWQVDEPFLHPRDGDPWERGGLYKSCLVEHGGTFYLFYNAKNEAAGPWIEQTGAVVSTDLKRWTRLAQNPLVTVGSPGAFDDRFASDPCVLRAGDVWVMFYYGLSGDGHARDGVAFSDDLVHWEKANEVLVDVGPDGSIDSRYAHKPSAFFHDGTLYHYYCAVAPALSSRIGQVEVSEIRGIAVARS